MTDAAGEGDKKDFQWHRDGRPLEADELRRLRGIMRETSPEEQRSVRGLLVEVERRKWLWALIRRIAGWTAATVAFVLLCKEYIAKVVRALFGAP